jgi:hypothetical protein
MSLGNPRKASFQAFSSGASRTRTGDLLGAIQERRREEPASRAVSGHSSSPKPLGNPTFTRGFWGWDALYFPKRRARPERVNGSSDAEASGGRIPLLRANRTGLATSSTGRRVGLSSSVDVNDYWREQGLSARTSRGLPGIPRSFRRPPAGCVRDALVVAAADERMRAGWVSPFDPLLTMRPIGNLSQLGDTSTWISCASLQNAPRGRRRRSLRRAPGARATRGAGGCA